VSARQRSRNDDFDGVDEMMRHVLICVVLPLCLVFTSSVGSHVDDFPVLKNPYLGQKPPASEPVIFSPGIVSDGSNHCSVAISPDGNEIYWEIGLKIGYSELRNGVWTKPKIVPFCKGDSYRYGNPFITPDDRKMFFTSFRPGAVSQDKENIWYSERTSLGWSDPKPISPEVNALRIHWSISVSDSGTLYFQGTHRGSDKKIGGIYYSRLADGVYTEPVLMGPEINGGYNETCPYVAPDESYILFNRFDQTDSDNCGIFISYRDESGEWLPAVRLLGGSPDKGGMSPRVSPDGKYLFYVNGSVFWMPSSLIDQLNPNE
jgi:hypothetical protein